MGIVSCMSKTICDLDGLGEVRCAGELVTCACGKSACSAHRTAKRCRACAHDVRLAILPGPGSVRVVDQHGRASLRS